VPLVKVNFHIIYYLKVTNYCTPRGCRGSHAVALAVGAISTLLISGSVFLKCFYSYRPRVVDLIMAIFLLLLWTGFQVRVLHLITLKYMTGSWSGGRDLLRPLWHSNRCKCKWLFIRVDGLLFKRLLCFFFLFRSSTNYSA
jgi:hypothetical protein